MTWISFLRIWQHEEPSEKKSNPAAALIVVALMATAGIGWFMLQKKKKKQVNVSPDPDADYYDEEEDYGIGSSEAYDRDPYEDEILDEGPEDTNDNEEED